MTTPSPTGTRKAGLRKFRNPPQHNVLNNHYRPLIKLNYRESRELAPPVQGKGNYENFVKFPPNPPRLPVKCKSTGTGLNRILAQCSLSGRAFTGKRHTGGLRFDWGITGRGSGGLRKFRNPLHKKCRLLPEKCSAIAGAKKTAVR